MIRGIAKNNVKRCLGRMNKRIKSCSIDGLFVDQTDTAIVRQFFSFIIIDPVVGNDLKTPVH